MKQPIKFANPSGLPWILVEKVSTAVSELEEFGSQFEIDLENSFLDTYLKLIMERKTRVDDAWRALDEIDEWIANPDNKITQEIANKRFLFVMLTALSLYVEALHAGSIEEFVDYFSEARLMHGHGTGIAWSEDEGLVRSLLAQKAGKAANVENEISKRNILKWYEENGHLFKNVTRASYAAAKIEPVTAPTAERWIRNHLRSKKS